MKTDEPIYTLLSTGAEAFRVLTGGLRLTGPYQFRSVTFKALERRADGVFEPQAGAAPTHVVEFQAQRVPGVWYNLMVKVGLLGEQHPRTDVRGILIFLHEQDDPGRPAGLARPDGPFHAVHLNRFLPQRLAQEPDNPYVAALAPLVIERDEELKTQAPKLWRTVQSAPIAEPVRDKLAEILAFWLFERFRHQPAEEIWSMLRQLTPLEETRAYRDIFAKGKAEGAIEGEAKGKAEGKAQSLARLLRRRFGPLPGWADARIAAAPAEQLDAWLDGVLDAAGLDELLGPAPPRADG